MCADAGELDDGSAAADDREVPDRAVAGEHDVVGEDNLAADVAIVADMRVGQKCAAVTDRRHHAAALGARVEGDAFAYDAVGANRQRRWLTRVLQILRLVAERGERKYARAGADCRAACDRHMAQQLAVLAKAHMATDRAMRPDANARA